VLSQFELIIARLQHCELEPIKPERLTAIPEQHNCFEFIERKYTGIEFLDESVWKRHGTECRRQWRLGYNYVCGSVIFY
jgi:hypothetical protein